MVDLINFANLKCWLFSVVVLCCEPGFWGEHCTNRCNSSCDLSGCSRSDGKCNNCSESFCVIIVTMNVTYQNVLSATRWMVAA